MAAYFQLLDKQTGEPTPFNLVDAELCEHFQQPIDPNLYLASWYDSIGFRAALGKTWEEIICEFETLIEQGEEWAKAQLSIAQYLQTKYNLNNWTGK